MNEYVVLVSVLVLTLLVSQHTIAVLGFSVPPFFKQMGQCWQSMRDGLTPKERATAEAREQLTDLYTTLDQSARRLLSELEQVDQQLAPITAAMRQKTQLSKSLNGKASVVKWPPHAMGLFAQKKSLEQQQAQIHQQMRGVRRKISELDTLRASTQILDASKKVTRQFKRMGMSTDEVSQIVDDAAATSDAIEDVNSVVNDGYEIDSGALEDELNDLLAQMGSGDEPEPLHVQQLEVELTVPHAAVGKETRRSALHDLLQPMDNKAVEREALLTY
jgi:methyl-accepting chemotaxis protein